VFGGYFLWFECVLRCIVVVRMVLTVIGGDNWLLDQSRGVVCGSGRVWNSIWIKKRFEIDSYSGSYG
jgi:hypothetical protein